MKKTRVLVFGTALLSLTLAGVVYAESHRGHRAGMMFDETDINGDAQITLEEMMAAAAKRFSEADANADGYLSVDEIAARGRAQSERRATRMLERLDSDGDGQLSQSELAARRNPADLFARLDTDGNGAISRSEAQEARKAFRGGKDRATD